MAYSNVLKNKFTAKQITSRKNISEVIIFMYRVC